MPFKFALMFFHNPITAPLMEYHLGIFICIIGKLKELLPLLPHSEFLRLRPVRSAFGGD